MEDAAQKSIFHKNYIIHFITYCKLFILEYAFPVKTSPLHLREISSAMLILVTKKQKLPQLFSQAVKTQYFDGKIPLSY